ncbi:restriction endonuclease [Alicycliphilus denitrificans]|uniref:restriction endonuclease n=1 Tax=Alicycliphilus denitrificans TaxID=179636 RepID=UPI0001DA05D8|nr:restriction endonuclease [Alicycliphilus denitrificans]ADV02229.1 restriction endonuclease [Alicycliphilus denitrificans BC]
MPRKRKSSGLDDLLALAAMLPWWLAVALAVLAYAVLHHYAGGQAVATPAQPGQLALDHLLKMLATIGQYLVPAVFLLGALVSVLGRRHRQRLVAQVWRSDDGEALRAMGWRDFERLVGEAFRLRGYDVIETGGGGADGGIDLKLKRASETFLVQCKHWQADKVPVNVVRELYGVMSAQGASGGFVVTSGVFTADAREFARGCNVELIDGPALKKMIDAAQGAADEGASAAVVATTIEPSCPRCGSAMIRRVAKSGAHAGREFWGCVSYPKCRGVRPLD